MDRARVESLTINQLRTLAAKLNLSTKGARPVILDRIIDYYSRNEGPSESDMEQLTGETGSERSEGTDLLEGVQITAGPSQSSRNIAQSATGERPFGLSSAQLGDGIPHRQEDRSGTNTAFNVQDIVQAVVQVMEQRQRTIDGARVMSQGARVMSQGARVVSQGARGGSTASADSNVSAQSWQQIKFATKLIPFFAGKEEENVVIWLERISGVARMHRINDEVIVLAAVTQLKDRTLEWYNRQPLESIASWDEFRFQIRRHFEIKESYTTTLARIGQRTWKAHTEKFVDYAEEKLSLMQALALSEKEKIELLADGVKEPGLRRMVLGSWATNIPDFLNYVRRVTEDATLAKKAETNTRLGGQNRYQNKGQAARQGTTEKTCFTCKQSGHESKDCTQRKVTCFKCGKEEHISPKCPKRGMATAAATSNLIEQKEESTEEKTETLTAATLHIEKTVTNKMDRPCIGVSSLNNSNVKLEALVDTGSPVSLIKNSVFKKYFHNKELFRVKDTINLQGVNGSAIRVIGKIFEQIVLDAKSDLRGIEEAKRGLTQIRVKQIRPIVGPIGVMVSGWCPCVPLGRRQSPAQQQQQQPPSSSRTPFTVSGATDRADMVQMFYYENRGKCCKKLLRYNGYPNKVLLFPEEGWARSASSSYWTLTPFWWSRSRCKVVEVAGTRRISQKPEDRESEDVFETCRKCTSYSTQAKMVDTGTGTLYIIGSFKRMTTDPDFKLYLTSNVSSSDFNMGYSMTGTLERGCKKTNSFQMTHFAVIRRRDYEKAYEDPNPT
ncbi:hypothetical protein DMN91_005859 [Ooceraea biroi]|uniref:CCHC-type domain-containing protein n=2 Tax=Apocrita TaxID=7400 RepID=A0A3L8DME4_OOCBI|nr:hypothetical protein DMN91_005859 [Ooceraea biroi]